MFDSVHAKSLAIDCQAERLHIANTGVTSDCLGNQLILMNQKACKQFG